MKIGISITSAYQTSDARAGASQMIARTKAAAAAGLDESVVMEKVTSLELDGLAERLAGGTYARAGSATAI